MNNKIKCLLAVAAATVGLMGCGMLASKPEPIVDKRIPQGMYVIGDYIQPGKYILLAKEDGGYNDIKVFESEDNYKNFNAVDCNTWEDTFNAFGDYGYYTVTLRELDGLYIELKEGYVLCTDEEIILNSYDLADVINKGEVINFDAGIMLVGEDIPTGQYEFVAAETDYNVDVLVFESMDVYKEYYAADRYTYGAASDAELKYSLISGSLSEGDSFSIYLKPGNIFIFEDGKLRIDMLQ